MSEMYVVGGVLGLMAFFTALGEYVIYNVFKADDDEESDVF